MGTGYWLGGNLVNGGMWSSNATAPLYDYNVLIQQSQQWGAYASDPVPVAPAVPPAKPKAKGPLDVLDERVREVCVAL